MRQFAPRDAAEAFRETYGRTILGVDIEPLAGNLEADITLRAFSVFGIASGWLSPTHSRRSPNLIDNDDLVLVLVQDGIGRLEQHGRRVEAGPGQVVLTDSGAVGTFTLPLTFRAINMRFSRALLAPQMADRGAALLAPRVADSPALRLLNSYAGFSRQQIAKALRRPRKARAPRRRSNPYFRWVGLPIRRRRWQMTCFRARNAG
jgi:hypothetical protein